MTKAYGYSVVVAERLKSADPELLGVQLGLLCLANNIPAEQVARKLGVSKQTVYNWFEGGHVHSRLQPAVLRYIATIK